MGRRNSATRRYSRSCVFAAHRRRRSRPLESQTSSDASGAIEGELRRRGVAADELSVAINRVVEALARTLDDERGRWALDAHSQAKSEWRLSGVMADEIVNVAIDRTFVDQEGVRWIIDFKTGGHEGGDVAAFLDSEQQRYRHQLEKYAALLQLLPGDSVPSATRLGLYFPQLKGWREWEWQML